MIVGLGTTGYVLQSQMTTKDSAGSAVSSGIVDRNAELTAILRGANVVPAGVTVEDVAPTKALTFYSKDESRYAVARLTDSRGTSGLMIVLSRKYTEMDCALVSGDFCQLDQANGISVVTYRELRGSSAVWVAKAERAGTLIEVRSDQVGDFRGDPFLPDTTARTFRPEPLLDRAALIKIATLPGLTY